MGWGLTGRGDVPKGDPAAAFGVGAGNEDGLVLKPVGSVDELTEGRVRLDKVVGGQGDAQLLGQVADAVGLGLSAAVGEQDEGDVVVLEKLQ